MARAFAKDDNLSLRSDQPLLLCCANCRHRPDDRQAIEQGVTGLIVFGSAYGASIGASRLCLLHDRLVSPDDVSLRFSAREA